MSYDEKLMSSLCIFYDSPPSTGKAPNKASPSIRTVRASPAVTGRATFVDDDVHSPEDAGQEHTTFKEGPSPVQKGNAIKKRPVQKNDVDSDDVSEENNRKPEKPAAKRGRPSSTATKKIADESDSESSLGSDIAKVKY